MQKQGRGRVVLCVAEGVVCGVVWSCVVWSVVLRCGVVCGAVLWCGWCGVVV
jgi:hypothetical protein